MTLFLYFYLQKKKTKIVDAFENEETSKSQRISASTKENDTTNKEIDAFDFQDTAAFDSIVPESENSIEVPTEAVGFTETDQIPIPEGIDQVDTI